MKKIVLAMVALLTMTTAVAQESEKKMDGKQQKEMKAPKEMTPEQRTERMASRLNLTAEQKTQVLQLNTAYKDYLKGPGMRGPRPPKKDFVDGQTGSTEQQPQAMQGKRPELTDAQRAQMKQHMTKRKEYDTKLKAILTADQYKEYQKMQPRRGHGPKGGRPEKKD